MRSGEEKQRGKETLARCKTDLTLLDRSVDELCTSLMMTFPGCLTKTVESLRKHKLAHWDRNRESNRAWLGLNMLTEARAGFRAFNEGHKGAREVDFVKLRQSLARGARWGDALIESVMPRRQEVSSK